MSAAPTSRHALERGDGRAEIGLVAAPGGARIAHLHQKTPLRVLCPHAEPGDLFTAALVTTSGGLAGGDRLVVDVELGSGARAVVASQAAEKVYRSTGDDTKFDVALKIERDAWLEWLPQETILFDGARLRRRLRVEIVSGGRWLACNSFVLGRRARGEVFTHGLFHDRWDVFVDGRLVWADAFRLDDPKIVDHPAGLAGAAAVGTVVYVGPEAEAATALMREAAETLPKAGATKIGGLALLRILEADPALLRKTLAQVIGRLRSEIAGLPALVPRLWQC